MNIHDLLRDAGLIDGDSTAAECGELVGFLAEMAEDYRRDLGINAARAAARGVDGAMDAVFWRLMVERAGDLAGELRFFADGDPVGVG